jgi:hypothetical protein
MKKYIVYETELKLGDDPSEVQEAVYLASEADARIDELESALQDALFALKKQREATSQWEHTVGAAIDQGEKTLALRSTG